MAGCELQDNLSDVSAWSNDEPEDALYVPRGDSYDPGNSFDSAAWAGESVKVEEDALVAASRAYQLEMFEESLKKNIIVAVGSILFVCSHRIASVQTGLTFSRWIPELERHVCKMHPCLSFCCLQITPPTALCLTVFFVLVSQSDPSHQGRAGAITPSQGPSSDLLRVRA